MNEKQKSNFDRLADQLDRYPSESKLGLYRNLYLGAAAICMVLLTQLLAIGASDTPLEVSVICSAIAMPLWLGLAGFFETYMMLGRKGYAHKGERIPRALIILMFSFGGIGLFVSIGAFLYHLLPFACYAFSSVTVVVLFAYYFFHFHLANWYYKQ